MKFSKVKELLDAEILCCADALEGEAKSAFGSDMMSDVLAFVRDQSVLLTGLINPQTVRTDQMMDIRCIVFVRGKRPNEAVVELAEENGILLLATDYRMYTACGILYSNGLFGEEVNK
jgi:predicted transcriptional regulator